MMILVAHGSRRPEWRRSVERMVETLAREIEPRAVRLAYMELGSPTLMEVAEEAVGSGARSVRVLPLFLTGEGHVYRDVRPLVDEVRDAFPDLDVELLAPMGAHPEFREALGRIAQRTEDTSIPAEARTA